MSSQESSRPKWLDDAFITKCVKTSRNIPDEQSIVLENVSVTYAVPRGENFLSVIYRVSLSFRSSITGDIDSDSYVIKSVIKNENMSLSNLIFDKEIDMYYNVLPNMQAILEERGLGTELSCRCLHYENGQQLIIALEDLKPRGFVLADRLKGLDLDHCKLVLGKLAKLHAASMHYFHNKESLIEKQYLLNAFERPENKPIANSIEDMARKNCDLIIKSLSGENRYKEAVKFITKYRDVLDQVKNIGVLNYKEGNKFNAINHGDCWTNNVMFQYDDFGNVQDVLFVDLQESNYSSVANDFNTLFFTSASQDVRREHFSELQEYYLTLLVTNLEKLEYVGELPTLEEFKNETRRHGHMVMNVLTVFCALVFMELDENTKGRSETESMSLKEVEQLVQGQQSSSLFLDVSRVCIDVMIEEQFFESTVLPEAKENG